MKTLKLFIVMLPLIAFFGCNEKEEEEKQTGVEEYVALLKSNQYQERELPAFTHNDIDELLRYRNAKEVITTFPRNLFSSHYQGECELGIYILWTIESIRTEAINASFLGRFPSLNPTLKLRTSNELELVFDAESYQTVSNAYYNWWTGNNDKRLIEIMKVNPLENTEYAWY